MQKLRRSVKAECLGLALTLAGQLGLATAWWHMDFFEDHSLRYAALLISLAPVALCHLLLGFLLTPLCVAGLLLSVLSLLTLANALKFSLTTEPLVGSDLMGLQNASVIPHYLAGPQLALIVAVLVCNGFLLRQSFRAGVKGRGSWGRFAACCVLAPLVLSPYMDAVSVTAADEITYRLEQAGIFYMPWSWPENVTRNGLPLHLLQTSRHSLPPEPTPAEVTSFEALRTSAAPKGPQDEARPRHVILILCEACWHDATHFQESFAELKKMGFVPMRAVSPVYGGGTVNASFELLTGLPAGGPLHGVIYQEYATLLSDEVQSYARALKTLGYRTLALHNNDRKFWKRDVIKPKLGFDAFLGLEAMGPREPSAYWADDAVLFEAALKALRASPGKQFMYLTTVATHGGYATKGDRGEGDYSQRLAKTIQELASFARAALALEPNTLILFTGDHKPALTRFFYEEGILPRDQFVSVGERDADFRFSLHGSRAVRGDVPAYVYHPDHARAQRFAAQAGGKPFFCVSALLNEAFTRANLPAFAYTSQKRICEPAAAEGYEGAAKSYPDWLYSRSLFHR
jgi:hypothetical protein